MRPSVVRGSTRTGTSISAHTAKASASVGGCASRRNASTATSKKLAEASNPAVTKLRAGLRAALRAARRKSGHELEASSGHCSTCFSKAFSAMRPAARNRRPAVKNPPERGSPGGRNGEPAAKIAPAEAVRMAANQPNRERAGPTDSPSRVTPRSRASGCIFTRSRIETIMATTPATNADNPPNAIASGSNEKRNKAPSDGSGHVADKYANSAGVYMAEAKEPIKDPTKATTAPSAR